MIWHGYIAIEYDVSWNNNDVAQLKSAILTLGTTDSLNPAENTHITQKSNVIIAESVWGIPESDIDALSIYLSRELNKPAGELTIYRLGRGEDRRSSGNRARSFLFGSALADVDNTGWSPWPGNEPNVSVENLKNAGPGSLRECMLLNWTATNISFNASGNIEIATTIFIPANTTIDGSTAPNGGICIKDNWLVIDSANVTIRHLRCRPGTKMGAGATLKILDNAANILVEHCSFSWSNDDMLVAHGTNVEIRYCIISEALEEQGKGVNFWWGGSNTKSVIFHHNLIALNWQRNPKFVMSANGWCGFYNNVIYGCTHNAVIDAPAVRQYIDIVSNRWVAGPETTGFEVECWDNPDIAHVYFSGNVGWNKPSVTAGNENDIVDTADRNNITYLQDPTNPIPAYVTDESTAYNDVLSNVGATLPKRDTVDQRVLQHVQNGTGLLIDNPSDVGGWPDLTL